MLSISLHWLTKTAGKYSGYLYYFSINKYKIDWGVKLATNQ